MKQFNLSKCDSYEELVGTIEEELMCDTIVKNDDAAEQWFKNAGIEGEVTHRDIYNQTIEVWNEEMQGEENFYVTVKEHYVDPGSDDYVYSYSIE